MMDPFEHEAGGMNLCQEVEMGVGKRQRKAKVFGNEDEYQKAIKKKKIAKKVLKNKEAEKKEKDAKVKFAKAKEKKKVVFIPAPVESKVLPSVALSHINKATQLVLSEDQMTCFGCEGGYRMVRSTHGVHQGGYFWEAMILPSSSHEAHFRIGWSTRQGELQAPVGYDAYSYGYRDVGGSKVYNSVRNDSYGSPYGPGDVIGCYIYLDDNTMNNKMIFFKNGVSQGIAYQGPEIKPGIYFPAVSIFMEGNVRVNFGPTYIVGHDLPGVQPISELQPFHPRDRFIHDQEMLELQATFRSQNRSHNNN